MLITRNGDKGETGSALLSVLGVVTVVLLLAGVVLAAFTMQHRFVRRDVDRWTAHYAAQGGLHYALNRLYADPDWTPVQGETTLPGGLRCSLNVAPFGGFYWIDAVSTVRSQRVVLRAMAGAAPGPAFSNAITLGDASAGVTLAGSTELRGDVATGALGLEYATFRGRPFRGSITGRIRQNAHAFYPQFDPQRYTRAAGVLEHEMDIGVSRQYDMDTHSSRTASDIRHRTGPVILGRSDTLRFTKPVRLLVKGNLTLTDGFSFAPGSVFAATDTLRLSGTARGVHGLFYAGHRVVVTDRAAVAGQFLAPQINVGGKAHLHYPSVLITVPPHAASPSWGGIHSSAHVIPAVPIDTTWIHVTDSATVDGTVVYPASLTAEQIPDVIPIQVDRAARVRGGLYGAHRMILHGRIDGTAVVQRFTFTNQGTEFVNWIKDAVIDRDARPPEYVTPLGFSDTPHLVLLNVETLFADRSAFPSPELQTNQ